MRLVSTKVLEPAQSRDIATLDAVKSDLGVTGGADDDYLKRAISSASSAIEAFCNRVFVVEKVQDRFDVEWPEATSICLSRFPVIAGSETYDSAAGLAIDLRSGVVYSASGGVLASPFSVTYRAGFEKIPADIEEAVISMVRAKYTARSRDPSIRSVNVVGIMQTDYYVGAPAGSKFGLPPDVETMIAHYRVPSAR